MSRSAPGTSNEVDHPLLARDPSGNLLPFPDGTAAWRIARETGGRMFEIRGADKAWVRIPIDAAPEQVAEQWGPGVYRVYALDAVGGSLHKEHVARWDLRNAGSDSHVFSASDLRPATTTAPVAPAGPTDLRFALEAMTHMLRTNSDALRMVAESHVDLAKSIAAAKGLPRNANLAELRALPAPEPDDGDDADDEYDVEPDSGVPAWVNQVLVPLAPVIKLGTDFLSSKLMPRSPESQSPSPSASANDSVSSADINMELVNAPGFEGRDLIDLNYAYRKSQAKRAHQAAGAGTGTSSLTARVMKDPELAERVIAVRNHLPIDDAALLMKALQSLTEEQLNELVAGLKAHSVSDAVVIARKMVADLRESIEAAVAPPAGDR